MSIEGHISHYIANIFSKLKGYSSLNINKYLKLNDFKNNRINLFDLYLKSYNNKEEININQKEIDYSLFKKKYRHFCIKKL